MTENLHAYRIQLRRYLLVQGITITADDRVCCPHPGHPDAEFHAELIEDKGDKGDRIKCDTCAAAWDIFDVEGFISGIGNSNANFPKRVAAVKEKLMIAAPEPTPGIDKPIATMSDEEIAARKAAAAEAQKATARAKAEAKAVQEKERRTRKDRLQETAPFRILGTADDGQAYFLDRNNRLQVLRLGSLTKTQLQLLAPIFWWIDNFQGARGRLDVDVAIDFVIEAANGKSFNPTNLRGRGCWRETDGSLVYNDGERTYGEPDADRIYQRKTRLDLGLDADPALAETRAGMWQAASALSFETQADCSRLLAWSILAPFCGALPVRPAVFLTGQSGSGKTTAMQNIVKPMSHGLYVTNATEAGVRQEMQLDCLPVINDEMEQDTEADHTKASNMFALARQSFSDDSPRILKGTVTGKSISYIARSMYMYAAVRPGYEREADANRIAVVEMIKPDNDWDAIEQGLIEAFTENNCASIRSFTWQHLPEIVNASRIFSRAVRSLTSMDTRYALMEGMLWAAHWRVWKDRIPEGNELTEWLKTLYEVKGVERPADDAETYLSRIFDEVVPLFDAPAKRYPLEHMLRALSTGQERPSENGDRPILIEETDRERYRKTCSQYGLYVNRGGDLCIAVKRSQISKIVGGPQYARVLARHPLCLKKSDPVTPSGETTRRCLIFAKSVLEGEPPI